MVAILGNEKKKIGSFGDQNMQYETKKKRKNI